MQGESAKEVYTWGCIPLVRKWVEESHGTFDDVQIGAKNSYLNLASKVASGGELDKAEVYSLAQSVLRLCSDVDDYADEVCMLAGNKAILDAIKLLTRDEWRNFLKENKKHKIEVFSSIMDGLCH